MSCVMKMVESIHDGKDGFESVTPKNNIFNGG